MRRATACVPARRERDDAVALWEAVVGEKVTRPDRFVAAAVRAERRPARLPLRHHRPARPAAARVRARPVDADAPARLERFKALAAGVERVSASGTCARCRSAAPRTISSMMLHAARGRRQRRRRAQPASRGLWSRVFAGPTCPTMRRAPAAKRRGRADRRRVAGDAIGVGRRPAARRAARSDRVRPARVRQRAARPSAATSSWRCARLSRYRMLMLTLERMGVTTPAVYASGRAPRGAHRRRSKAAAASSRRRSSRARSRSSRA